MAAWETGRDQRGSRRLAGYRGPVTEMFTEEYMARHQQQIEITRNTGLY